MSEQNTPGRLYIRTNRHPNIDGTPWGWVDLYEPGSMRQSSPAGIQVTWSRGQKSEANARRLVACWNACEGIDTEHLENIDMLGETLAGRFAAFHASERELMDTRDELLEALKHIEGVALADEWRDLPEIAKHARAAIAKAEGGAA